jgi:hypothetical protein
MRQRKVAGLLGIAAFILAVMLSSAALALPSLLPETGLTITASGGEGKYVTLAGTELSCKGSTAEVKFAAKTNLAPIHISLTGCTSPTLGGAKCTGLTDTAGSGTVLTLGEIHLVYDSLTTLGVAALILIEEMHFECGSLASVNEKGSLLCLISPINKKVKTTETVPLKCEASGAKTGDPKETQYWNAAGVSQTASLLLSLNSGTFESSAETATASLKATTEYELMG